MLSPLRRLDWASVDASPLCFFSGATVAALCVYDMCKAVSHDIVVSDVRLLGKTGGKRDVGSDGVDGGEL